MRIYALYDHFKLCPISYYLYQLPAYLSPLHLLTLCCPCFFPSLGLYNLHCFTFFPIVCLLPFCFLSPHDILQFSKGFRFVSPAVLDKKLHRYDAQIISPTVPLNFFILISMCHNYCSAHPSIHSSPVKHTSHLPI